VHGAYLVCLNARTGRQWWKTLGDPDPTIIVTGSPTVDDDVVYLGTSSKAEDLSQETMFRAVRSMRSRRAPAASWRKTDTIPKG
jgi:polyvinyl alcohol dehydrogenase (cytochrome)